ncbi:MAG: HAD family hydrolase [Acidimicrobiales bacterium]|nr:HAD family hydrolase [Acidimicrobiales bacterium]
MIRPTRGVVFDTRRPVRGVVFDKDGTLLDFHATWDATFGALLVDFADGDAEVLAMLDERLGFDRGVGTILENSPFVADSNAQFAAKLAAIIGRAPDDPTLEREIDEAVHRHAPAMPTAEAGAHELLTELARRGIPMAIATNDSENRSRGQMVALGWDGDLMGVFGADSGHGEKPDPGMVVAAAAAMGLDPTEVAMVGDSSTDMGAGNASGAVTVLYGGRVELRETAAVVIDRLGEIIGLIDA